MQSSEESEEEVMKTETPKIAIRIDDKRAKVFLDLENTISSFT